MTFLRLAPAYPTIAARTSRRETSAEQRLDPGRAALLHDRDEALLDPLLAHQRLRGLARDLRVPQVRVLSGRVVSPDGHAADLARLRAGLLGELPQRAVVIEARHRGEVARVEIAGIGAGDESG